MQQRVPDGNGAGAEVYLGPREQRPSRSLCAALLGWGCVEAGGVQGHNGVRVHARHPKGARAGTGHACVSSTGEHADGQCAHAPPCPCQLAQPG
jgi:hypothetical protein